MTFSGIALDSWAAGSYLVNATILIVIVCLLISSILFTIRVCQVYRQNQSMKVSKKEMLLQACHLSAMFFSCFYTFLYVWNYVHIYTHCNEMNCAVWFVLIMVSITLTKVSMYAFLMLRSALAFRNSFFRISLRLAVSVTSISVVSQFIMMALMLSDFTATTLFEDKSTCFRTLGPNGTFGIAGFNISDAISSAIALLIFWCKAKNVNSILFNNQSKQTSDTELTQVFNKHIRVGMLIALGSLLIFLAGEFLTILMGLASTLHQCFNNIYLFLLFKENATYYAMCCQCGGAQTHPADTLNLHLEQAFDAKAPKHAQTEGYQSSKITSDIGVASEVQCTKSILAPTFLSKSLSSLPRCNRAYQRDKRSLSSNCLQPPTKLALSRLPTLTATPTAAAMNKVNVNHAMQFSFTPYSATCATSGMMPPLQQPTPCNNMRNSGSINFKIPEHNNIPTLEIVYGE